MKDVADIESCGAYKCEFVNKYSASEEDVNWAIHEEVFKTDIALEMRHRIENEAGVYQYENEKCWITRCHFVALGLLAQDGKVPRDLLNGRIEWYKDCYVRVEGGLRYSYDAADMMLRFLKWYDNELIANGFPERLVEVDPEKSNGFYIMRRGVQEVSTEIRNIRRLRDFEHVCWPTSTAGRCSSVKLSDFS